jgi:hypothetical protein
MENTTVELAILKTATDEAMEAQLRQLSELQLAFVGGGAGDVTLS